jgi:hypothetical protein
MRRKSTRKESSNSNKEQLELQPHSRGPFLSALPFAPTYSSPNSPNPNILLLQQPILMMKIIYMMTMMTWTSMMLKD